ncbi:Putative regulatory protein [Salmonella enterica subsp. enterica]|nr:Putative regulatory protein [Salmonella enterica subsp. enterica]
MSQQRPTVSNRCCITFGNTGTSQHNKLLSFLAMQRQPCAGFSLYLPAVIPVWFAAMVVLTSTTVRKIKNMFSTLSERYKARRNAKSPPSPARSSRMETAFFSTPAPPVWNWQKCLVDAKVKVICNDIKIANELGGFPHVESYIIGGLIRPGYFSVGEILALEMINAFAVERAFISCDALSIETGITNATMFEVGVKTRIIQRSREVILMADHSKFDTVEPHAVATLSCITTILSDSALPSAIARRYQQAGCRLIMSAPSSGAR